MTYYKLYNHIESTNTFSAAVQDGLHVLCKDINNSDVQQWLANIRSVNPNYNLVWRMAE